MRGRSSGEPTNIANVLKLRSYICCVRMISTNIELNNAMSMLIQTVDLNIVDPYPQLYTFEISAEF